MRALPRAITDRIPAKSPCPALPCLASPSARRRASQPKPTHFPSVHRLPAHTLEVRCWDAKIVPFAVLTATAAVALASVSTRCHAQTYGGGLAPTPGTIIDDELRPLLEPWRRVDMSGLACAHCHAPDAMDLALFSIAGGQDSGTDRTGVCGSTGRRRGNRNGDPRNRGEQHALTAAASIDRAGVGCTQRCRRNPTTSIAAASAMC